MIIENITKISLRDHLISVEAAGFEMHYIWQRRGGIKVVIWRWMLNN